MKTSYHLCNIQLHIVACLRNPFYESLDKQVLLMLFFCIGMHLFVRRTLKKILHTQQISFSLRAYPWVLSGGDFVAFSVLCECLVFVLLLLCCFCVGDILLIMLFYFCFFSVIYCCSLKVVRECCVRCCDCCFGDNNSSKCDLFMLEK